MSLQDGNNLSQQKRKLIKAILRLQRQKLKDNQARKSKDFEHPVYGLPHGYCSSNDDDQEALLNK